MIKSKKKKAVRSTVGLSTLDGFLKDQGKLEDFQATAIKEVLAWQIAEAMKANILDSQRNGQKYRDFTRRSIEAGVQGYFAFLRGQRVTYFGRQGDQHTEWFPGAAPVK